MGSKFFPPLAVLLIALGEAAFAQSGFSFVESDRSAVKIVQRLSWEAEAYAGRYGIIIEKEENQSYLEILQESTRNAFIEVSLTAGRYRYRIQVYDLLDRPQGNTPWEYFTVRLALQPEIQSFAPEAFFLGEETAWRITLTGRNLAAGAEVLLRQQGLGPRQGLAPDMPIILDESGQSMVLHFDPRRLGVGTFAFYVRDPSGLDTSLGGFHIYPGVPPTPELYGKTPVTIKVSAGYAALVPLYGKFLAIFDTPFEPLGFYARIGVTPFKQAWGALGIELEPFWNYLAGSKDGRSFFAHSLGGHINFLYQRRMLFIPSLGVSLRLGAGITSTLDYHHNNGISDSESLNTWNWSLGLEASLQWFPTERFFLEAGLAYGNVFTTNDSVIQGYLRPMLGAGMQL
jgi:hypothetical protein